MDAIKIAKIVHAANKAYCESIGDMSQKDWADAPDWQKVSAIKGVKFHIENPECSPADSHEEWLKEKKEQGWIYGSIKDIERKIHPCFRPYSELPKEQQVKDFIFKAIVDNLSVFVKI